MTGRRLASETVEIGTNSSSSGAKLIGTTQTSTQKKGFLMIEY
jgi:hypothetical protein